VTHNVNHHKQSVPDSTKLRIVTSVTNKTNTRQYKAQNTNQAQIHTMSITIERYVTLQTKKIANSKSDG